MSSHNAAAPGAPHAEGGEEEHPKKRKKRRAEDKKLDVSINSLLDVLSVILVFLMKSYSTSSVQVKPSADLQVPFTHSVEQVEESTAITITRKDVMVDDAPVVTLSDGKVAESDRSEAGFLIDPLFSRLKDEVAKLKKIEAKNSSAKFKGVCTIIADRYVPFPVIAQVMYTAGQAEYGDFKFALIKSER
jgi:biopolymer transport protein ExbD